MKSQLTRSIGMCIALCLSSSLAAQTGIDGAQVLDGLSVTPKEVSKLESGEILTFSDETYENNKRELAADAVILVKSDLDTVVAAITENATIVPAHKAIAFAIINSEADFSGVNFTDAEYDEVKKLIAAKPGKNLNFSDSEYALLRQKLGPYRNSDRAAQIVAASDVMREILIARYRAYQENGLDGIDTYSRSKSKKVDIGRELRVSTETFQPFEADFPKFYKVMHDYPAGAECCVHYFRWIKLKIRKRPTFALLHTMVQKTDDFALATERYFYATSTLNSLQVTLSWLEYDEDTYMGLAMSTSTDLLDSTMGRMLRPLGRNKAKDTVSEIMLDMKAELEAVEATDATIE